MMRWSWARRDDGRYDVGPADTEGVAIAKDAEVAANIALAMNEYEDRIRSEENLERDHEQRSAGKRREATEGTPYEE